MKKNQNLINRSFHFISFSVVSAYYVSVKFLRFLVQLILSVASSHIPESPCLYFCSFRNLCFRFSHPPPRLQGFEQLCARESAKNDLTSADHQPSVAVEREIIRAKGKNHIKTARRFWFDNSNQLTACISINLTLTRLYLEIFILFFFSLFSESHVNYVFLFFFLNNNLF